MTAFIIFIALFASWLSPYDPMDQNVLIRLTAPAIRHLFGTDDYGRDVLSRCIWGSPISLSVGIGSILFGLAIGTTMGITAGFRVESVEI